MKRTNIKLRNLVIYQIYVRNFSLKGDFQAVIDDLDRIHSLGVDVVYLLPVHPVGVKGRKGQLGCPYSIQDYNAIAKELGTMEDFQALIDAVHQHQMKFMMDVVYNHTSKDSVLYQTHPEYFLKNDLGEAVSKVADWSDVIDLDYKNHPDLWTTLSDTLVTYAKMGVDAFRCDVASVVPLDFWTLARKKVRKVNSKLFWLSESVHGSFLKYLRDQGYEVASEAEIYSVFDMAYDYDIHNYFEDYFEGKRPLKDYLEAVIRQEEVYPANYVKMKYLENHDTLRIAKYLDNDLDKIKNWTAFLFFQKGAVLLYMGQEYTADIRPSLFDKEIWEKRTDISNLICSLAKMKKKRIFTDGIFKLIIPETQGVAQIVFENASEKYMGLFNLEQVEGDLLVDLADGDYRNRLNSRKVKVRDGRITLDKEPVIIRIQK